MTLSLCNTTFGCEEKVENLTTHHAHDLDDIDPCSNWIAKDVDPLFIVDKIVDLMRDEDK